MGWLPLILFAAGALAFGYWQLRRRNAGPWLWPYLMQVGRRRRPRAGERVHVLLCIADHYEPGLGRPEQAVADARVTRWVRDYPAKLGRFRDSDGRPPRHTFFFPLEDYYPLHLEGLAQICHAGYGEVEVHLHHDNDTAEHLRQSLLEFKDILVQRHGLLARHRESGEPAYGFIHGNWALDNSRPDGKWCGVNNELDVLRETGCYADFTLPSAPSPTQTRTINSIYYAIDDPLRPKSHDQGVPVGGGPVPSDSLLLIQGPLLLDWGRRKWQVIPRLENGCIQANQVPVMRRLDNWLRARVQVPSRPDWYFVKLYTHGAKEANADVLLGEPMIRFHQSLADRAAKDPNFSFHYVTAREMYNLVRAAEAGWKGSVADARDYELIANSAVAGPVVEQGQVS